MKQIATILVGLLAIIAPQLSATAHAQHLQQVGAVEVELVADADVVVPGQPMRLGLRLKHQPDWHTYWENPGDSGLPTQFNLTLPDGFTVDPIQWPRPTRFLIGPLANLGFDREVVLVRRLSPPKEIDGSSIVIGALAQWLVCREVCVPGEANLELKLPVAATDQAAAGPGANAWRFDDAARERPAGPTPVAVARVGDSLHMHLPAALVPGNPQRIEYFGRTGDTIHHAGEQQLYRLDNNAGWRLQVPLGDAMRNGTTEKTLADAGRGLVVFDDSRSLLVTGRTDADPGDFAGGTLQARIAGHAVAFLEQQQNAAQGLLAATGARTAPSVLQGKLSGANSNQGPSSAGNLAARLGQRAADSAPLPAALPAAAQGTDSLVNSLSLAVAFALVGGIILNLMPCVFPVIGLKILGFAGSGTGDPTAGLSAQQRANVRQGCLWFAAGVVLSFLVLAVLLLALKSAGQAIGWGFQLQSAPFVAVMSLLFVAIGLNFAGLFEIGSSLTRLGQLDAPAATDAAAAGPAPARSFLTGVLAVLVATPCTAPFMGSALGYTLSQSAVVTLIVFAALGVGMSLPYLLLGLMPGWLRWLPRPGRWMESFKQFLAFPMFAAAAWLVWVLGQQAGIDGVLWLLAAMVLMALGLWIVGRFVQGGGGAVEMSLALSLVLIGSAVALGWPSQVQVNQQRASAPAASADWRPWSTVAVQRALASGKSVFIDFTAAWCVTCQVNKKLVLGKAAVRSAMKKNNVELLVADWTNQDPAITAELARHGRNSVPFYLVYRPDGKAPVVLPEILTESVVLAALNGP